MDIDVEVCGEASVQKSLASANKTVSVNTHSAAPVTEAASTHATELKVVVVEASENHKGILAKDIESVTQSFDQCSREWRWGLWSPNDRRWFELVHKQWPVTTVTESETPLIPLKVHHVWLGANQIPPRCQDMIASWRAMHPTWEHRLWTDADVETELACPRLLDIFKRANNPAERSDIMRLAILLRHGGLYVDVDFECLQPFDLLQCRHTFFAGVSNVGAFEINNGLFAASPGHPLLQFLCDNVARPWPEWGQDDVDPGEAVAFQLERSGMLGASLFTPAMPPAAEPQAAAFLATTGPGFFTRGVMRWLARECASVESHAAKGEVFGGGVAIFPPEVFYPLSNALRDRPPSERTLHATDVSMAMHHWCRTWMIAKQDAE
eukprot:TRINITY_DN20686_c0_g1_i1.p1 TRINITY_DN20686_c0_g1~~TRINITY_DN20686_c0_g1_i1.p1  ORF type:complete len:380 (+),score=48.10 TRINITY_DN20686_c0_g1_i1:75-1214(+)